MCEVQRGSERRRCVLKLLTKEIKKKLPALYSTDGKKGERAVAVKFFTPWTNWTWFVLEGDEQENGDYLFFGLVEGHEAELGYFTLHELESVRGPAGLKIERDIHFDSTLQEAAPDFCEKLWGEDKLVNPFDPKE